MPRPAPARPPVVAGAVAAVVLAAAVLVLSSATALPPTVARVNVVNPHAWDAQVSVTSGDGQLGLGAVSREGSRAFEEVIDVGDTWRFRFSYAGTVEELAVSRAELEEGGWQVSVPPAFADRLGDAGTSESA